MDIQKNSAKPLFPRQAYGDQSNAVSRANDQLNNLFANRPLNPNNANALIQTLTNLIAQLLKQSNPGQSGGGMIAIYGAPVTPTPNPPTDGSGGGGIAYPVYGAPIDPNPAPPPSDGGGIIRPVYGAPVDATPIRAIYGAPVALDSTKI